MLGAAGVCVRDQFVPALHIQGLADCAHARQTRGEFAAARIGKQNPHRSAAIRGDFTCWLGEPLYPAERMLLEALERLRLELNRETYLGLFDVELHYACYPPGAAYARHVDQPRGAAQRRVSLVLYLNTGWGPAEGGALRLYNAEGGFEDIEPIAGRLVCFLTQGQEHAVLPAQRDRWSISGWFRARD